MRIKTPLLLSLRALLGAVFVVSGLEKLMSPAQNFAAVIEKFEILRGAPVTALSQVLPWLEFLGGVFLVLGFWERISLWLLWAMNTGFIGVLSQALLRKLPIDQCGCFGEAVALSLPKILAIDIGLWALFFLYLRASSKVSLPGLDRKFGGHGDR